MTASINALSPQSPATAPGENSRRELQARLSGLGDLNGNKLSPEAKAKKLREACEGFESVFIQKMWQEMRNTLPKNGLLQSRDERFWQDMYDQELAKSMTSAGGIGLADMMYEQLSRNLVSASRSTVGQGQISAFRPASAPLLPQAAAQPEEMPDENTSQQKTKTGTPSPVALASIYEDPTVQKGISPDPQVQTQPVSQSDNTGTGKAEANKAGSSQTELPLTNPEIERALAALRSQQALARSIEDDAAKNTRAERGSSPRRQRAPSGLELARMAQREAGDKLGLHSVRPPIQPSNRNVGSDRISPLTATKDDVQASSAAADTGQQIRNMRYTTNMPEMAAKDRGKKLARSLSVESVNPNSRAGAGLAAYHASQDAQQPTQPLPPVAPLTPAAPTVQEPASAGFSIPPLTADNLKS